MTQSYFPFDSGAGANVAEDQWRKMGRLWLPTGVVKGELLGLVVFADSTGMQVKVRSGRAWIEGHFFESDAEVVLTLGSNSSGSTRIDRVIIRADFTANTIALAVLAGTPGAGAPAVTQSTSTWEISLAQVSVPSGGVSIDAAQVTDERRLTATATGELAFAQVTANQAGITTIVDLTGLTVTATVGASRRIRLVADLNILSTVGGDAATVFITDSANVVQDKASLLLSAFDLPVQVVADLAPTAGPKTYKARLQRRSGTGTLSLIAGSDQPATLSFEDKGVVV